jgi:hypothetical protein
MHNRLKKARINAGYKSATAAIKACGWPNSTYRAHENGQNNFSVETAEIYAKAYGVSAAWLLVGADGGADEYYVKSRVKAHKHNCAEKIYALGVLIRDEPTSRPLLLKLSECVQSQLKKIS